MGKKKRKTKTPHEDDARVIDWLLAIDFDVGKNWVDA